jgi:glycosyltransferase involved in cell wall biosynthesis
MKRVARAIVVAEELYPPWYKGERVYAKNLVNLLRDIYDSITLIIVGKRDEKTARLLVTNSQMNCEFCTDHKHSLTLIKSMLSREDSLHLIQTSWVKYLSVIPQVKTYIYVFTLKAYDTYSLRNYFALPLLSRFHLATIVTTSPKIFMRLRSISGRDRCHYVPAPVIPCNHKFTRRKPVRCSDAIRVVYLGPPAYVRFPYIEVCEAFDKLRSDGFNLHLSVFLPTRSWRGESSFSFAKKITSLVREKELSRAITVCIRNLSEKEKYAILGNAHILLYPALHEAAVDPPAIILEAMISGCCVVSTPVQSIPLLLDSTRGVLLTRRDLSVAIYDSLRKLVENPSLINSYGSNARAYALKHHDPRVIRHRLADILSSG